MTDSTLPKLSTLGLTTASLAVCLVSGILTADTRQAGMDQTPLAGLDGGLSELVGIWSVDCSNPDEYFTLFNHTHMMTISGSDSVAGYTNLADSWANDEAVQLNPSENDLIWTIGSGESADVYEDQRCSSLPPMQTALHGEAVTFFQQSDDLMQACAASGQNCIETFFEHADIASTGGINEADLSRLIRIGAYFAVFDDNGQAQFSDIAAGQAASVALAPLASNLLIRSFDYDADGQLSIAEVTADRGLFDADDLSPATGAASELEDGLRQSVQQLQQLLMMMQ